MQLSVVPGRRSRGDLLDVAGRMMDADRAGRRGAARVPAGVVDVPCGIRRLRQLDEREIRVGARRAEGRAVLIVVEESAGRRDSAGARRRLVVPVDDHRRGFGRARHAMRGAEEIRLAIVRHVGERACRVQMKVAVLVVVDEFVVRDRADLVRIRLAERTDDVDVARARRAGAGVLDRLSR